VRPHSHERTQRQIQAQTHAQARIGLAAINTIRAQCESDPKFTGQYPPVTADDVTIYDDECRSRVVSGQKFIVLSFDVPTATDAYMMYDAIYVTISTAEAVGDIDENAANATSVSINATGYAADFRLVAVRKFDTESGEGQVPWTCDFLDWETGALVDGEWGEDDSTDYLLDEDYAYNEQLDPSQDSLASSTAAPKKRRRRLSSSSGNPRDDSGNVIGNVGGRKYLRVEDVTQHAHGVHASRRRNSIADTLSAAEKAAILESLPKDYDPRNMSFPIPTPPMITVPTDQSTCSSCWAFAGTTVLSWRLYLQSQGKYNVVPSHQIAMTCGSGSVIGKCDEGGYASYVFETANKGYLPAAAMAPYTKTVAAEDRVFCEDPDPSADALARIASSISYRTKPTKAGEGEEDDHVATTSIQAVETAMKEIFENGPVGMYVEWDDKLLSTYPANPSVCNGIQTDRNCSASKTEGNKMEDDGKSCVFDSINHAIAAIGWGEDPIGCPDQGLPGPIKYATIRTAFARRYRLSACWALLLMQGGHLASCQVLDNPEFARRWDRRLRRHWVWILQD
jgi:hypothetical protein